MNSEIIIATVSEFDTGLVQFKESTRLNMELALRLSQFSIQHFAQHGDLGPCERFYKSMVKNYHRRTAYLKWLTLYAPVTVDGGIFKKDKSEDAVEFDIVGALRKPFWEAVPSTEETKYWGSDDLVAAIAALIKRYDSDKNRPMNEAAAETLGAVKHFMEDIQKVHFDPVKDAA